MKEIWTFITEHWAALLVALLALIEVMVRLTPSTKDNAWFKWLKNLIDYLFSNFKTGGGRH